MKRPEDIRMHVCEWVIIAGAYAPPAEYGTHITNADTDLLAKLALGVTTIVWECSICQEIKKEEILGKRII